MKSLARAKPAPPPLNPDLETFPVEVDDPLEHGAKLTVVRRATNFIAKEYKAGRLDKAQFEAAREFERLRELTMSSGLSSPSFAREYVDGGGRGDPITDKVVIAFKRLSKARQVVGIWAYEAIDQCICHGLNPTAIEERTGANRKLTAGYVKDGLEMLAIYWGFATDKHHVRRRAAIERMVGEDFVLVVETGQ